MFSVLIVVLMMSSMASARPLEAALGTGFTYQGQLTDDGAPASGTYDFEFNLYDDLSGGSQVGSTIIQGDVTVTAGLFTVQLDFGDVFDGTALYLEIFVRPGASVEAYTALAPRQALTATPYAIYASKAPWSGLSGVPADFADGVDNGSAYQNIKIVAKSGGDFTTITAALDSITDAGTTNRYLIYVAPGVYSERVTMKQYVDIEGAGELTTKITYTGSVSNNTGTLLGANDSELRFLTVENTGGAANAIAIYNNSASPRLTHVTASASGGALNIGVYNISSSPTMVNVSASASGGTSYGVFNNNYSEPTMTDVSASASGSNSYGVYNTSSSPTMVNVSASVSGVSNSYGVYNNNYSEPTMTNVSANASGGGYNYGVRNDNSSPTMTNVSAIASGGTYNYGVNNVNSSSPTMTDVTASALLGTNNYGVYNTSSSSPTMTNVTASASGSAYANYGVRNDFFCLPTMTNVTASASGGSSGYGVYNASSSPTMVNVSASALGGTHNYGVYNLDSSPTINNSVISGTTNTIRNASTSSTTRVGASQLSGGAVFGGTVTCAGVYDETYTFYASTCP